MPIYEYKCRKCYKRFELRRSVHDKDEEIKCPSCSTSHPERQFSMFAQGKTSSGGSCGPSGGFS